MVEKRRKGGYSSFANQMPLAAGATLVQEALAPMREAAELLAAQRIPEALAALSTERLGQALKEGVQQEAALAGLAPTRVQALLPWEDVLGALARLAESRD